MIKINVDSLLKKFRKKFIKAIEIDYGVGSAVAIVNAFKQGVDVRNNNPLSLTKKDQELNIEIIETLIKDVDSSIAKQINYLTNKSITERWSTNMLAKQLKTLNIEETYKNRFKTIAQNESFRIMSDAQHKKSVKLGAKKKWIYNPMDNKTADDSMISDSKYGSEDKAIPIDKPFSYTYKGKTRTFMYGADRVNDRSQTVYVYE